MVFPFDQGYLLKDLLYQVEPFPDLLRRDHHNKLLTPYLTNPPEMT